MASVYYNGKIGSHVENCIIRDNEYSGIEFFRDIEIRYCLIVHNGGVGVEYSPTIGFTPVLIDHCTIAFNRYGFIYEEVPPKTDDFRSAISVDTATIQYSMIVYNTYDGIRNHFAYPAPYKCIASNVYGNGNFDWQNDYYTAGDEFGNISRVPAFL